MDSIVLSLDLEDLLKEIENVKTEYIIKPPVYEMSREQYKYILNILFKWIEENKVQHIRFNKITFLYDVWIVLNCLIRFSSLREVTFDKSYCVNNHSISSKYYVRAGVNLVETIFKSNIKKINYIDEPFSSNNILQLCGSLKNNYRLMEINFYIEGKEDYEEYDIINYYIMRNRQGWMKIKNAVYTILMISTFAENNFISNLPNEIVLMLCECIIGTRDDSIWYNEKDKIKN